jgi:pyrimidine-nucleoside phosphorylase
MNPVELILKKRNGYKLTTAEIDFFINSYLDGTITDYQMSAFLMAVYFQGMLPDEITAITDCYIKSGRQIIFPDGIITADKHSTGGVGDKISLMLAPIAATCGLYVPMISGRGLGHTGGTLDKLEAIPGFQTQFTMEQFRDLTLKHGVCMVGQSAELVPADKKIYALRDVTATVESPGLITPSIMSKKIAEGAKHLVIDLKVGSGAFMPTLSRAKELAELLIKTGHAFGQKVTVVFTNMNAPLGTHIGNALEVIEAIEYLKGNYLPDTQFITETLTAEMLLSAGLATDKEHAIVQVREVIANGKALQKFEEMITAQGGDAQVCHDYSRFASVKYKLPIVATTDGYVQSIDSKNIGYALIGIKAGRIKVSDEIDYGSGAVLYPKVGDRVEKGQGIGILHTNDKTAGETAISRILESYLVVPNEVPKEGIIIGRMSLADLKD